MSKLAKGAHKDAALSILFRNDPATLLGELGAVDEKNPLLGNEDDNLDEGDQRNRQYAMIVYRTYSALVKGVSGLSKEEVERYQTEAATAFQSAQQQTLPDLDVLSIRFPTLGPLNLLGEGPMEGYNRVFNLLRHFGVSVTKANWKERLGRVSDPFESKLITPDNAPLWMCPSTTTNTRPIQKEPTPPPPSTKPPVEVKIEWRKTFLHHFGERLTFPKLKQSVPIHLEEIDELQLRDTIRRVYNFRDLDCQFEGAVIHYTQDDEEADPEELYPNCEWQRCQTCLAESHDPVIIFTLRQLEDGEDLYESNQPPLTLSSILQNVENDVAPTQYGAASFSRITSETDPVTARLVGARAQAPTDAADRVEGNVDGFDLSTPKGKEDWAKWAIPKVKGFIPMARVKKGKKINASFDSMADIAKAEGEIAAREIDVSFDLILQTCLGLHGLQVETDQDFQVDETDKASKLVRFYKVQHVFTGAASQVGPRIDLCIKVLAMQFTRLDGRARKWSCLLITRAKRDYYEYQVNGAVWMLSRSLGAMPGNLPEAHTALPEVKAAMDRLKGPRTYGGFVVDSTGLGKTIMVLLFLALFSQYHQEEKHRPTLLTVPTAVIKQWADEIQQHWKMFRLVVAYGDRTQFAKGTTFMSAKAMRNLPRTSRLPRHLKRMFNVEDPEASKYIVLTTYETIASRTISIVKKITKVAIPHDPPVHDDNGNEAFMQEEQSKSVYVSNAEGFFGMIIGDEGHRCRHAATKTHASLKLLKAKYVWLITATPVINEPMVSSSIYLQTCLE